MTDTVRIVVDIVPGLRQLWSHELQRDPCVHTLGEVADEAAGHHADHRVVDRPDPNHATDHRSITAVDGPPVGVTKDNDGCCRSGTILFGSEDPTDLWRDAEQRPVMMVGVDQRDLPGVGAEADAGGRRPVSRHRRKQTVLLAEIEVRAIGRLEPGETSGTDGFGTVHVQPEDSVGVEHMRRS